MDPEFDIAFMSGGCGWPAECLNQPDSPLLAAKLAEAFDRVRHTWQAASPAEREEFWNWVCEELWEPPPPILPKKRTSAKVNRALPRS